MFFSNSTEPIRGKKNIHLERAYYGVLEADCGM